MTESGGLLVIDKPSGPTSFQCVRAVRRILGVKRVGHCGTLDPMAQGVLLVLFGPATRRQVDFLGLEKQYWFRARWGETSETGDREGRQRTAHPKAFPTLEALQERLHAFTGALQQTPPAYSALKYKGKPYYDYARKGVSIPRAPRAIQIYSFLALSTDSESWTARVRCSRGTYIRTLAEDVGRSFGSGCLLEALVRERVGPYTREASLSWPQVESATSSELFSHALATIDHHAGIV